MRTKTMLVVTQGINAGRHHTNKQGSCKIVVTTGFNEPQNSITVDCYKGSENEIMNITFEDGKQFNGTFEELKSKLF